MAPRIQVNLNPSLFPLLVGTFFYLRNFSSFILPPCLSLLTPLLSFRWNLPLSPFCSVSFVVNFVLNFLVLSGWYELTRFPKGRLLYRVHFRDSSLPQIDHGDMKDYPSRVISVSKREGRVRFVSRT